MVKFVKSQKVFFGFGPIFQKKLCLSTFQKLVDTDFVHFLKMGSSTGSPLLTLFFETLEKQPCYIENRVSRGLPVHDQKRPSKINLPLPSKLYVFLFPRIFSDFSL